MADNYLENRMDDLRSGRLQKSAHHSSVSNKSKGFLSFRFPPRKALISVADNTPPQLLPLIKDIISRFVNLDSKVAIIANLFLNHFQDLFPSGTGIRLIKNTNLSHELDLLYSKWLNIDIIISFTYFDIPELYHLVSQRMLRLPSPSFYNPRLVNISANKIDVFPLPLTLPLPNRSPLHSIQDHSSLTDSVLFLCCKNNLLVKSIDLVTD